MHIRMSHLWLEANYIHGATLLDITTSKSVPPELLVDVCGIITTVSFQISSDTHDDDYIEHAAPFWRGELKKLVGEVRAMSDDYVASARVAGVTDIGLAFWRDVANNKIEFKQSAKAAYTWFSKTIRAFLAISPSEAAAERAFSCAKFVLDGRDALQDANLERAVVLRSYFQRRCKTKKEWAALVSHFAAGVNERRNARKQNR